MGERRAGRLSAGVIAVAALVLAVSLFLHWQTPVNPYGGGHFTSIFGSVDRETAILNHLRHGRDGWHASTLVAVVLAVVAVVSLGLAVRVLIGRPVTLAAAAAIGAGGAATTAICALKLAQGYRTETADLHAYGGPQQSIVLGVQGRLEHGPGVVAGLVAGVVLLLGAIRLGAATLDARRRGPHASDLGRT